MERKQKRIVFSLQFLVKMAFLDCVAFCLSFCLLFVFSFHFGTECIWHSQFVSVGDGLCLIVLCDFCMFGLAATKSTLSHNKFQKRVRSRKTVQRFSLRGGCPRTDRQTTRQTTSQSDM